MSAAHIRLTVSWFPTAMPKGPAIGDPECLTWEAFSGVFWPGDHWRREGEKDGPCVVPARFQLEPDGRHVRRLKQNIVARTAVALDVETKVQTGEVPPPLSATRAQVAKAGWAAVLYTSHRHTTATPRYRLMLPLSEEIDPDLPVGELVADRLRLGDVLDRGKLGASSVFYLPSANPGELDQHECHALDGNPVDATWVREVGAAMRAREAAEAHATAVARHQARLAAGDNPDDPLIDRIRQHLDLAQILLSHGYARQGTKFRHPHSSSGSFGADIKTFGGIERVFSHNANDPLHASNLPDWCDVTAIDAVDATVILSFGGDRTKALGELAEGYGLSKAPERRAVAGLIFQLIREQAAQGDIETAAFAKGARLGLSVAEVCQVASWVAARATAAEGV
jgi:hypothetical protein